MVFGEKCPFFVKFSIFCPGCLIVASFCVFRSEISHVSFRQIQHYIVQAV